MSDDEPGTLAEIMARHQGPEEAITSGELAERLGVADDEANPRTRSMMRALIERTGMPIAANHQGYYVIENVRQKREYIERLDQRIEGIKERKIMVERAWTGENQGTLGGEGWSE